MLSAPLRYAVYVAGVVLMFFVALGLGATTAVVVDWQFGQTKTGSSESSSSESSSLKSSMMETTGIDEALDEAGIEPSTDSETSNDTIHKAPFVHKATEGNSRGDYTYISEPRIDRDANAVVFVAPTSVQENLRSDSYPHNVGVWYEPQKRKWAIFNEDRAAVPEGATFNVTVPQASASFVHRAKPDNISGTFTYLDDPMTNGEPDAVLSVTQNWNPGGGTGIYNDHSIDTVYSTNRGKWAIYNNDGAPMPEGAAFNITISPTAHENLR